MIDTQTRLMGLLGKPLGQSYSAIMHDAAFRALSLNCEYLLIESEADALSDLIAGMRRMNFVGFNVTKPYKVAILEHLDGLDELAAAIGAVNTVKKENGRFIGYNTDGLGFMDSLTEELGFSVNGKTFAILGAGGAARALAATFSFHGAKRIFLHDVLPEASRQLAEHINKSIRPCAAAVSREELGSAIAESDCLINASGVGMYPHTELSPVEKRWLRKELAVCDLTYNPRRTQLLLDAEAAGCPVLNGLGMLIHQGARAFAIWLDTPAPVDAMRGSVAARI